MNFFIITYLSSDQLNMRFVVFFLNFRFLFVFPMFKIFSSYASKHEREEKITKEMGTPSA